MRGVIASADSAKSPSLQWLSLHSIQGLCTSPRAVTSKRLTKAQDPFPHVLMLVIFRLAVLTLRFLLTAAPSRWKLMPLLAWLLMLSSQISHRRLPLMMRVVEPLNYLPIKFPMTTSTQVLDLAKNYTVEAFPEFDYFCTSPIFTGRPFVDATGGSL